MPITDAMKNSVLYEGQPQYSLEDNEKFSNNLEIKTKKGYNGNTKSSRKTE